MSVLLTRARQLLQSDPVLTTIAWFVRIGIILVFLFVAYTYLRDRPHALTVIATTEHVEVNTGPASEQLNTWDMHDIVLCVRNEKTSSVAGKDPDCGSMQFYKRVDTDDATVNWPAETNLVFRSGNPEHLVVVVDSLPANETIRTSTGIEIITGSRLLVDWDRIEQGGGVKLLGDVVIGERAELPSSTHFLKTGRYEIHEKLYRHPPGVPIAQGDFVAGDQVSVVWTHPSRVHEKVNSYMFLTRGRFSGERFDVVMTTPFALTRLKLSRLGADPALIYASAGARVREHAFWAVAVALLGFLGAALGIANHLVPKPKSKRNS